MIVKVVVTCVKHASWIEKKFVLQYIVPVPYEQKIKLGPKEIQKLWKVLALFSDNDKFTRKRKIIKRMVKYKEIQ